MIQEHIEESKAEFEGTILDIETIGEFDRVYSYDSRNYRKLQQVIFGYITKEKLHIFCARTLEGIEKLRLLTPEIFAGLKRPYYAFNCNFESGVWFHHAGMQIDFDGELQGEPFESKKNAILRLRISNYNDPFYDQGFMCIKAWNDRDFAKAIAHNRACLLKERDILLKRGHCEPDKV
ncbi:MAG TPA: hypothetical protein VF318_04510, partial [Dehalococcoidales bacterium]